MPSPRARCLWLRIALPVLGFVALGSLALALWLHAAARRESSTLFATLARTNAELMRSAKLPGDARTAGELRRVLGMHVHFRHGAWDVEQSPGGALTLRRGTELVPPVEGALARHGALISALRSERGIVRAGRDFEVIAVPVHDALSLILVRPVQPPLAFLTRSETVVALGTFWVASLALAWVIARGVVRPLRLLAERLPEIGTDTRVSLPGAERDDEIGQLVRSYLATRRALTEERARREKIERLALLGRMATGLAHEIHNPLSAIRLHAQLLDSTPAPNLGDATRAALPILLDETGKIEGLVNQWMFLARPTPPQISSSDLGALVAEVVRAHIAAAAHAGVQLTNRVPPGVTASVDARRFTQAVRNVIVNAIHAMPGGGELTIDAACEAGTVRLIFCDHGPGFSPAALARHADLFYSEKEGGMGIGLSVTSEILRAHRGALAVANAPEGGAVVTFIFPAG